MKLLGTYQLGEIRKGIDIGKNPSSSKFTWVYCLECSKPRWVRLIKGEPEHPRCHSCANGIGKTYKRGAANGKWKGGRSKTVQGYILVRLYPEDSFITKMGLETITGWRT